MATVYRQVSVQSLECPICLVIFKEPKSLSCSHTFCKNCLSLLVQCQSERERLPCPVCSVITDVPDGDVSQLQTNIPLRNLIEDATMREQECIACSSVERKVLAVTYCQECDQYMCHSCEESHLQWKAFSSHEVVSISDLSSGKASIRRRHKCQKHPDKDEECYCKRCKEYVCFQCGFMEHKEHGVIEATVHEDGQRQRILELQSKANEKRDIMKTYVGLIEETQPKLEEESRRVLRDIDETFEEVVNLLSAKRDALKMEVRQVMDKPTNQLQDMKDVAEIHVKQMDAICELLGDGPRIPLERETLAAHETLCDYLAENVTTKKPCLKSPSHIAVQAVYGLCFNENKDLRECSLGTINWAEKRRVSPVAEGNDPSSGDVRSDHGSNRIQGAGHRGAKGRARSFRNLFHWRRRRDRSEDEGLSATPPNEGSDDFVFVDYDD